MQAGSDASLLAPGGQPRKAVNKWPSSYMVQCTQIQVLDIL